MKKQYSERVISAFLNNMKTVDIARAAGISATTVRQYRKDPELQRVLNERKRDLVTAAVDNMRGFLKEGSDILIKIIRDDETPAQTRVNALNLLFTQLRDWMTTTEIQQRIEILEIAGTVENRSYLAASDGETGSL